eukprot:SAG31_NODE_3384_length_4334_cov_5.140496_4_plen_100_part_00
MGGCTGWKRQRLPGPTPHFGDAGSGADLIARPPDGPLPDAVTRGPLRACHSKCHIGKVNREVSAAETAHRGHTISALSRWSRSLSSQSRMTIQGAFHFI